jgi:PAS domain S-box-containing protein
VVSERQGDGAATAALTSLIAAVQDATTLEVALDAVVRLAPPMLGVTQCALFLYDAFDNRLLPVVASGIPAAAMPAFYGLEGSPSIGAFRRAIDTRQPVLARTGEPESGIPAAVASTFDVRTMLVVPLVSGGRVMGLIALQTPGEDGSFAPESVLRARDVAAHAASAIHRERLVRETQARLNEHAARVAISDAVVNTHDPVEMMRRIAREMGRALGADMVGAYLTNPEGTMLRPIAGYHVPRELRAVFVEWPLPITGSPGHEELWRARRPFWTSDAAADPRLDPEMLRRFPHRSNLVVPLLMKGEGLGVLVLLWWHAARVITPDELRLAECMAGQAAMFVANAQLYGALEDRLAQEQQTRHRLERSERRQAAFAEIVKELAAETEPEHLFALITRRAGELFEADAAFVTLIEDGDVVLRGHWGIADLSKVTPRRPIAQTHLARAVRERTVERVSDMTAEPRWQGADVAREGYRAVLNGPIILHDEVIGVVGVLQRTPREYSDEDARLLMALGEHCALAVDRSQLRAQRESRLRDTERLLAVSQAVASTLDAVEIARRTVREMARAVDADIGGAWMIADDGVTLLPLAGYRVPLALLEGLGGLGLTVSHPLIAEALHLEGPMHFPDSAGDPGLDHPLLRRIKHQSLLICPMRSGGDTVGGFALAWTHGQHTCPDSELRLVEGMARQAAVGLQNARLLTAERESREGFAASEARYRELFENVLDIVYVHDLDGVIREINGAGVRLSGYTREELIGRNLLEFLAPADARRAIEMIRQMQSGATDVGLFTAIFENKDGTRSLLECRGRLLHRDGVPVGVHGVARDITLRRQLEDRQAALVTLSRELAHEVDVDALLGRIAERVRALVRVSGTLLLLFDGDTLTFGGSSGLEPELVARHSADVVETRLVDAVRGGRSVVSAELASDPAWAGRLGRVGYRALVAVPLAVQDRVLGVLEVLDRDPRAFSATDVEFLEALATQAALALDNVRLIAQTKARLRETETLLALGESVVPTTDLTERMRRLSRETSRAFGADMVGAYLAEPDGARLIPIAGYHVPATLIDEFLRFPIPIAGHAGLEEAWRQRTPVATLDMTADVRVLPEIRRKFPCRTAVFAPMVVQDRPIGGVFLVWWEKERVLTTHELKLLAAICRHAALFVENARLFSEATARRQEAEELARLARGLTENLDVAEVGRRTARSALLLLGGVFSTLRILTPERTLTLAASSGDTRWVVDAPMPLEPPASVAASAAVTGRPAWSANVRTEADREYPEAWRDRLAEHGAIALLSVPLHVKGELIGVLSIADRAGHVFQARDVALLEAFADQAAIALENSRLYGDLRAALDKVEESQQQVVQVERLRALGELAGGVAHDFNNSLAIIVGRTEALVASVDDPSLERHLDVILRVAFDAAQTVQRIQNFARKRVARPFEPVDLNDLVDEVVEVTRTRWKNAAEARGVRYDMNVEHGVIPKVAGDPAELREAFTNIVLNGLDAMPDGGELTMRTSLEGDRVVVLVRDSGVGMAAAVMRRVFDPFFTTKGERGTGLGLSVVYGIVTRHGGNIEVDSKPGGGTTFTLSLPANEPLPTAPARSAGLTKPKPARILIVDDEPEIREVLSYALGEDGHAIVTCKDGQGAIAALEHARFDLVITDLGMPGVSGWDVARAVKARRPGTPVVMVTGWREQINPAEAAREGVDHLIAKPFRRDEVRETIATALASSRAQK